MKPFISNHHLNKPSKYKKVINILSSTIGVASLYFSLILNLCTSYIYSGVKLGHIEGFLLLIKMYSIIQSLYMNLKPKIGKFYCK